MIACVRRRPNRGRGGQGLAEYALVLVLVSVLTLVALEAIGVSTVGFFDATGNRLREIPGS